MRTSVAEWRDILRKEKKREPARFWLRGPVQAKVSL
jgi:hypothetical protein